jgi:hypothetical protein
MPEHLDSTSRSKTQTKENVGKQLIEYLEKMERKI